MIERKEVSQRRYRSPSIRAVVQRGGEPGNDVEDWVRAEKELGGEPNFAQARAKAAQQGRN